MRRRADLRPSESSAAAGQRRDIKQAIIAAVRFEDACFKYFVVDSTDYWDRCVRAVALAARKSPVYLESTYQQARNDVAYYNK